MIGPQMRTVMRVRIQTWVLGYGEEWNKGGGGFQAASKVYYSSAKFQALAFSVVS